jgi:phosphatidylglycerophosphate synthase
MTTPSPPLATTPRRVLATRNARWAVALARALGRAGVRPNAVSMAGIGFGVAAGAAFSYVSDAPPATRTALLLAAAVSIQLRLLCNLLDGMLAIEGGLKSKTGDIYNDLPDRLADVVILVGAGYAVRASAYGVTLGWAAAILAVFTAYVRVLAGSLGVKQHFIGPMAKQHRMFTLTVVTLAGVVEALLDAPPRAIYAGLIVIVAGSIVTVIRRTLRMASEMHAR